MVFTSAVYFYYNLYLLLFFLLIFSIAVEVRLTSRVRVPAMVDYCIVDPISSYSLFT